MSHSAYVHMLISGAVKWAWETHSVEDLRSTNTVPFDNYQLKSQDVVVNFQLGESSSGKAGMIASSETNEDGHHQKCLSSAKYESEAAAFASDEYQEYEEQQNQDREEWQHRDREAETEEQGFTDGMFGGHTLTDKERFETMTPKFCFDVVIRCTGFELDRSLFQFDIPTQGGRNHRKYPKLDETWASPSAQGLYFIGTLAHVRDAGKKGDKGGDGRASVKSSGGEIHGFRCDVVTVVVQSSLSTLSGTRCVLCSSGWNSSTSTCHGHALR